MRKILEWSTLQKHQILRQIPPSDLISQHGERVTTPKLLPINCLRYLQTSLVMEEQDWSQSLCEELSKKQMKNKRRFKKAWHALKNPQYA